MPHESLPCLVHLPPYPGHLHGCGRRPHLALQGHLCPEAHVLVSEIRTHHPLARRCPGSCDLAGGEGGLRSGTGRAGPAGLGWAAGGAPGEGGWGLAGSSGEVLSAVLINYLPATGLLAAAGCLPANTLSHVWSGMWTRVGSHLGVWRLHVAPDTSSPAAHQGSPTCEHRCTLHTLATLTYYLLPSLLGH